MVIYRWFILRNWHSPIDARNSRSWRYIVAAIPLTQSSDLFVENSPRFARKKTQNTRDMCLVFGKPINSTYLIQGTLVLRVFWKTLPSEQLSNIGMEEKQIKPRQILVSEYIKNYLQLFTYFIQNSRSFMACLSFYYH